MLDDGFPEPAVVPVPAERCLPGAVLRASREAQGLSVSDVAQVIRFSVRQIDALERDDYTGFPGITLLRGFVRSYAKFLKIDATPLLAALEPAAPIAVADVRPPGNIGVADQPGLASSKKLRLLIAGLLALVALAVALRFMAPGDNLVSAAAPAQTVVQPAAPASANEANEANVPVVGPIASAPPGLPTAEIPALASSVPVTAASPIATSGLRVELTDRSWIEIRDAMQNVVMSGEYPAGARQNVVGKPPFQVWIGKAAGVRVFMGERNIDLQPFTRAEVARLTVE